LISKTDIYNSVDITLYGKGGTALTHIPQLIPSYCQRNSSWRYKQLSVARSIRSLPQLLLLARYTAAPGIMLLGIMLSYSSQCVHFPARFASRYWHLSNSNQQQHPWALVLLNHWLLSQKAHPR